MIPVLKIAFELRRRLHCHKARAIFNFFAYFLFYQQKFNRKIVDFSGIRTQIVSIEGEPFGHLTTAKNMSYTIACSLKLSFPYNHLDKK